MADDKIAQVMEKVEEFYFGDGEENGEVIFNKFAAKHAAMFDAECDAVKLRTSLSKNNKFLNRYTQVYNEF